MLFQIAGTNHDDYIKAIRQTINKGYTILLARDIDEGYIDANTHSYFPHP